MTSADDSGDHVVRSDRPRADELSEGRIALLAVAAAIVTANAYYIHPIIAPVAASFGVSDALVGAVPAFNQVALAIGIFFLLPLGDRFSNRRLTISLLSKFESKFNLNKFKKKKKKNYLRKLYNKYERKKLFKK